MKRKIELLAPGGDIDSIKAAIAAGADAVYCGLSRFNARNRATNLKFEELNGILNLAHRNNCKVFLTLNIIFVESEIPSLIGILNKLANTKIDGVIVQDFGLFYLLNRYFKGLKIHASTQLTTHNEGQIGFLSKLAATRVNLSRELSIDEIRALTSVSHKNGVLTEVFVHGSYCISFSGICYISSVHGGNSGNRGRCSQPCRDRYLVTPAGKNFPLNLKDNSAYFDLPEISAAGVDSIKIEGRMKKTDYIFTVVNCWKKQINTFYDENRLNADSSDLYKVFNRDFSNAYLKGDIGKDMFIDNPRDNSVKRLSEINPHSSNEDVQKDETNLFNEKAQIITHVNREIEQLSAVRVSLKITISGEPGVPLNVFIETPDTSFRVLSESNLVYAGSSDSYLNYDDILKRLDVLNSTEYRIERLELKDLQNSLFLPFSEFTSLKRRILYILNGSNRIIDPIDVPSLEKPIKSEIIPTLALLISSKEELSFCRNSSADIYFQLPNVFKDEYDDILDLFLKNEMMVPWFPSVLIGENYAAAIRFLSEVQPRHIVTNNTGVAYEAYLKGIPWIAGPFLNLVNSFSLLCLKEKFNCSGAFISNELNKYQIKCITKPDKFKLYYSVYHPILLLSSRQCLVQPIIGCEKNKIENDCIQKCIKSSLLKNLSNESFFVNKTRGNYHCIYNSSNYLNTDIVGDFPDLFSSYLVDLRDIATETKMEGDKIECVKHFENFINGNSDSEIILKQIIRPSTNAQYKKGI